MKPFVNQKVLRALSDTPLTYAALQEATGIGDKELRGATTHLCAMGLIIEKDRDVFNLSIFGSKLVKDIQI